MNNNSLIAKIKDFLIPLTALVFIFFLLSFFLVPKMKGIFSLRADNKRQLEKINQLSLKLADLQTLSEAELFDSASLLLEALPAQKDFYKVLKIVKKNAKDAGVALESFKFSPGIISTGSSSLNELGTMRFSLTFTTLFSDLRKFLGLTDKSLPIIFVESLKLTSPISTVSASMQVKGTMEIKSFVSPLPKNLGNIEKSLAKISNQEKKLIEELRTYNRYQAEIFSSESVIIGKENPF